jgi:ATP-dependent helicase/nuclease subunit B
LPGFGRAHRGLRYNTEMPLPRGIAAAIEAGDTVITSSARGARALRRLHAEAQREEGREAWLAAHIVHWDLWLDRLWQTLLRTGNESRLLLTPLQEQQVWTRVLRPGVERKHLISVLSVSELAQSAYALLGAYDAFDFLRGDILAGPDVESFRAWALTFQRECLREGWLSRSLLPLALMEAVRAGQVQATARLVLVGFDRLTPAQLSLVEAFRQQGHSVEMAGETDAAASSSPLVRTMDRNDEIATCALWVRNQLDALGSSARLAVVVTGADAMRAEIERTFRQVLAPETTLISSREQPPPFEFSLGVPLAQLPMARSALLLLRWLHRGLLQDEASWLLLSGLICEDAAEQLSMARLDARLRQQMRQPEQDFDVYLQLLDKNWPETASLGRLRRRLLEAQRSIPLNSELSFADWVQRAGQVLDAVQWPGAHSSASEDFQVQARWSQLLDAVAELAFDGRTVTYDSFLEVLEQQARQTIYSPESRDAPVQILGPFEAAGLTFDAMWFLSADDASWPAVARPHPFLTRSLQREHAMPHADGDVDFQLAQQVTLRLRASAPQCLFSYAAQNAEGLCRPSALLANFVTPVQADVFRLTIGAREDLAAMHNFPLALLEPELAVVVPWPEERDAGGADVLRDQAACPFRAFANRRLGARAMDEGDWGLDPRARGTLVHVVLDKLWAALVNRDALVRVQSEGRLTLLIGFYLDEAMQRYREEGPKRNWNTAYLATEHERVLSILEDWLAYEARRDDFTVEAREDKRAANVGGLKLQLRVDRVDQIADGRVIIDYKTGMVKTDIWDGPRMDEPQLPIYAGFCGVEDVQGVLLGRVAEGKQEFVGRVVNYKAVSPSQPSLSRTPYSETMLEEWKGNLQGLAEQFLRGDALVDPKQYPKTCQYCPLPGLCRIAETNPGAREGLVDEDDGEPE